MIPIDWTEEQVRLECEQCGAVTRMGSRAYFWALGREVQIACPTCRASSALADRRQLAIPVSQDRRVPSPA